MHVLSSTHTCISVNMAIKESCSAKEHCDNCNLMFDHGLDGSFTCLAYGKVAANSSLAVRFVS